MPNIIKNKKTWDKCAHIYEHHIVNGHPDIRKYENFEEQFLDSIIEHLIKQKKKKIKIMDIGCGSGRIHHHYASQSTKFADNLDEVWGIDFSNNMLQLAAQKLKKDNLFKQSKIKLNFQLGSAFDIKSLNDDCFPVVISLINTIGVMQGKEGAKLLLKTMKNIIKNTGGILLLSCYRKKYLKDYALGQYESTMDVSGQPIWLEPNEYTGNDYRLVPSQYKLAYDTNPKIAVDVFNKNNECIKKNHILKRNPTKVKELLTNGKIKTFNNYNSNWYSYEQINSWINEFWANEKNLWHIKTNKLDPDNAEPCQLAIYDSEGILKNLM
jgi:ubiquinone/menaquinone biosynthesis C-methylase UbiE